MDGERLDQIGRLLATRDSRRTTLRRVAVGALAIGLGRLSLKDAAAACKKVGQKCTKNHECCSKLCKGKKCKCRAVGDPCSETADCCGGAICLNDGHICHKLPPIQLPICRKAGQSCGVGAACCTGLICSSADGDTCQVPRLQPLCSPLGGHCETSSACCAGLICHGILHFCVF